MKNNLKKMIRIHGISQAELCRRADSFNPTSLSQIATQTKNPSLATAQRLAKALGATVESVFPQFKNQQAGQAGSVGHEI